ncbi:hypothetical protein Pmani_027540 [Petrolisthes manimaculis]|uniref:Uncharacterized protein n=1 Tax=Petrolisthes manimaculis TaxID=1843537 RepID=A0AAE1P2Q8_9EUCA|nr:hypothetical protein Pmani_027540 [Petrolisthes manimaculis]
MEEGWRMVEKKGNEEKRGRRMEEERKEGLLYRCIVSLKSVIYIYTFYHRLGIQDECEGVVGGECVPLLARPPSGPGAPHPYAPTHRRRNNRE